MRPMQHQMNIAMLQVDYDRLYTAILDEPICLQRPPAGWSSRNIRETLVLSQVSVILDRASGTQVTALDNLTRLEAHQQAAAAITIALMGTSGTPHSAQFLEHAVNPAVSAAFGCNSSLKLKRFSALRSKLCTEVVPAVYRDSVEGCWPEVQQAMLHARGEQCIPLLNSGGGGAYRNLATKIANLLAQEVTWRLANVADLEAKAGPPAGWLQEDEGSVQRRQSTQAKRQGIFDAQNTIKDIDSMIKR